MAATANGIIVRANMVYEMKKIKHTIIYTVFYFSRNKIISAEIIYFTCANATTFVKSLSNARLV
jgi:hypothetical protein